MGGGGPQMWVSCSTSLTRPSIIKERRVGSWPKKDLSSNFPFSIARSLRSLKGVILPPPKQAGQKMFSRQRWRKLRSGQLGAPTGTNLDEHGQARFTTVSGVPVRRLYTPADLPEDWSHEKYLGFPGQPPFTRGIHATGYRGKMFTMRQFSVRIAGGDQPAVQVFTEEWRKRAFRRLRFAHPDGL